MSQTEVQPIRAALSSMRHVSWRTEAAALRASEALYRSFVESAEDPMFRVDANPRFVYVNAVAAGLLGKTPADMLGQGPQDFFSPAVANAHRRSMTRVFDTGETVHELDLTEVAGGQQRWLNTLLP